MHAAQFVGARDQGQQMVVPPFFVDGDDLVEAGIVEHHVLELFVDEHGDVGIRRRLPQGADEGRRQRQVAQVHEECHQDAFPVEFHVLHFLSPARRAVRFSLYSWNTRSGVRAVMHFQSSQCFFRHPAQGTGATRMVEASLP